MDTNSKPSKKILIVEDEPTLGKIYETSLRREGFEVFRAENGLEGLEKAIVYRPDAILLDIMMPVMDGKSMLYKLRETPGFEKTPVFILTNAGDISNIIFTKKYLDAVEFIIKSNVEPSEIVAKLKEHLWY